MARSYFVIISTSKMAPQAHDIPAIVGLLANIGVFRGNLSTIIVGELIATLGLRGHIHIILTHRFSTKTAAL